MLTSIQRQRYSTTAEELALCWWPQITKYMKYAEALILFKTVQMPLLLISNTPDVKVDLSFYLSRHIIRLQQNLLYLWTTFILQRPIKPAICSSKSHLAHKQPVHLSYICSHTDSFQSRLTAATLSSCCHSNIALISVSQWQHMLPLKTIHEQQRAGTH